MSLDDGLDFIDTILGTSSHPGLLDDLSVQANTTLILRGFQSKHVESKDSYDRREELLHALAGLVNSKYYSTFENTTKPFLPRLVGCTQRNPDYFDNNDAIFIKVPSFESRTKDLKDIARGKIKSHEQEFPRLVKVELSKEATQRLMDHRWGIDGDAELDQELFRGLKLLSEEKKWNPFTPNLLQSKHILVNAYNEKIRNRLLYNVPFLRQIIMTPWVVDHTLRYIVTPAFIAILAILFLGPQTRERNTALTVSQHVDL